MPTLSEIARLIGAPEPPGDAGARAVTGLGTLEDAVPGEVTYISSDAFVKQLATTRAAAVIVDKRVRLPQGTPAQGTSDRAPVLLVVPDAELAVAQVLELFAPPIP